MAENHGSQWDIMMNVIVDSGKYLNKNAFQFTDEISTFDYMNTNPELSKCLRQWILKLNQKRNRSIALSNSYRVKGNKFYKDITKQHELAADYYTNAIFSSPKDSEELALAHANRASCFLYTHGSTEDGYNDCVLALKFNYPLRKRDKLLQRKFSLANTISKKEETLREMDDLVENNIYTEEELKLPSQRKSFEDLKERMQNDGSTNLEQPTKIDSIVQNKQIIEKFKDSVGRYVVAGEPIEKNQPILRENAFAFVPVYNNYDPDTILYHCQNCAKTNCTPFPCYDCARATYCSLFCFDQHKNIHKYECAGYEKNLWMKIGIAHLAFRNFIVGFADSIERLDDVDTTIDQILSKLTGLMDANFRYGNVLRLVTNFDKMEADDCLRYALTAQMLAIYLDECTDFFTHLPEKCRQIMSDKNAWKNYTATVLMRHMGQLVSNGHAISGLELMPPTLYDYNYRYFDAIELHDLHLVVSSSRIFTANFPTISILNHSCDPNIWNRFDGPNLTIYASRDIGNKEEIFNCYGPHFKLMPRTERQSALKQQYCFDCNCEKCIINDRTFEKYFDYICPNQQCRLSIPINLQEKQWWHHINDERLMLQVKSQFHCNSCKKSLPLNSKSLQEFFELTETENNSGYRFFRNRNMTEAAISYYMEVSKCLSKHHELKAVMAQALLRYQMHADEELFTQLAYIAMENYVIARERFGQFSLEMIMTITYALNVLQMANKLERKTSNQKILYEITKIRKVLDINKIEKSIMILSTVMHDVFKKAIDSINKKSQIYSVDKIERGQ